MTVKTILVVEDEGLIALHLAELLKKNGFRVIGPVSSGEMALQEIRKTPLPDLVLMDIVLAGKLDGVATARQIRNLFPSLPLIFVTAHPLEMTDARIEGIVPEGIMDKPFLDSDMVDLIAAVLKGTNG